VGERFVNGEDMQLIYFIHLRRQLDPHVTDLAVTEAICLLCIVC
jgi:heme/copper-type cytochrome/quinol oxidase subunit 4